MMSKNVEKCRKMLKNVKNSGIIKICRKMSKDVEKCRHPVWGGGPIMVNEKTNKDSSRFDPAKHGKCSISQQSKSVGICQDLLIVNRVGRALVKIGQDWPRLS